MSLALALAQIQRPSFWNDFSACDYAGNINKKIKTQTSNKDLLAEAVRLLAHAKVPVLHADLVIDMDITSAKLRSIIAPLVEAGKIVRTYVKDKMYVELIDATPLEEIQPQKLIGQNKQRHDENRAKVIAAISDGHHLITHIGKAAGLGHTSVESHLHKLLNDGLVIATQERMNSPIVWRLAKS